MVSNHTSNQCIDQSLLSNYFLRSPNGSSIWEGSVLSGIFSGMGSNRSGNYIFPQLVGVIFQDTLTNGFNVPHVVLRVRILKDGIYTHFAVYKREINRGDRSVSDECGGQPFISKSLLMRLEFLWKGILSTL